MASSKCNVDSCKRDFDTLCAHCQNNFCTRHYNEHVKLANDELIPLADKLNSIVYSIQRHVPLHQVFEQLERWRENSHRYIDQLCEEKRRQLHADVQEKVEKQMKKLRQLSEQVKELIDEGDASFKQIEKIKIDIEECQEQCRQFIQGDNLRLNLKPIEIETSVVNGRLFCDNTLLSIEQQRKLNEFYGKKDQKWMLIYKATRDGFGGKDFHRCCDNQGATMTIIQSKNGGHLFGGYISVSWRSVGYYVADSNDPFIFTLTNPHGIPPTKYPIKNVRYSILDTDNCGPIFGGGDIFVHGNSDKNTDCDSNFPHSYIDTTNRGNVTFTGRKNFQTNEIEVYRLM